LASIANGALMSDIFDRIFVSCPNGGGLFLVDHGKTIKINQFNSTGFDIKEFSVLRGLQDFGAVFNGEEVWETINTDGSFDDVHDVLFVHDSCYIVGTMSNAIIRLDSHGREVERWAFSDIRDSWHINCLAYWNGDVVYSAFGEFDEERGYKSNSEETGFVRTLSEGRELISGLSQPHSLTPDGDRLVLANSGHMEIREYAPDGRLIRAANLGGYTRGICIGADALYVGLSCSRNIEENGRDAAVIVALDRHSWEELGRLQLPSREIYAIKHVDDSDTLALVLDRLREGDAALATGSRSQDIISKSSIRKTYERIPGCMMNSSRYIYNFSIGDGSTASTVVTFVGEGKRVLELGCGPGMMTRVFFENGCKVVGVDNNPELLEDVQKFCEKVIILDIEDISWDEILEDRRFDVIVAADVLEHLREPAACLQQLSKYLAEDGCFVISIPNICHNGIIAELLHDDFMYRETGLLDATHLRFFGLSGLKRMLSSAGLVIDDMQPTRLHPSLSEFAHSWNSLPAWLANGLEEREGGDIYQYVLKAVISDRVAEEDGRRNTARGLPSVCELEKRMLEAEAGKLEARSEAEQARARLAEMEAAVLSLKNSRSWRLTSPGRFFCRLWRYGLLEEDRNRIFNALRNRYHRLPLPLGFKKAVSFTCHKVLKRSLNRVAQKLRANPSFVAPSWRPAPQAELPDYFVWGVIDWHFRHQRPQQLALAIAESGRRVFYISPNFVDDDRAGFEVEALYSSGSIFQFRLHVQGAPSIYSSDPGSEEIGRIRRSVGEILEWANCGRVVCLVDHPYWHEMAGALPNSRLVYDCMDYHAGFENTGGALRELEQGLIAAADLTIATSGPLLDDVRERAVRCALIRNGCDFNHFSEPPANVFQDPEGRPVIGYYGAIAEWFDLDLVEAVATALPECLVMLIGADTVGAKSKLAPLPNVLFTGEIPYDDLPRYLHGFAVCLLPFRVIPLTLATNPVKVYEYLSAGKPVVAVDLPEMSQFEGFVAVAGDRKTFVQAVREAVNRSEEEDVILKRKTFARSQTWHHRAEALLRNAEDESREPMVSVVVVTFGNINLTRECLRSIDENSQYAHLEIIVVDNASSDGTPEYLRQWVTESGNRKVILNEKNRGFAAANNQGLSSATGDYLILLNNDTYVTPGWVGTLLRHLRRDPTIGLIGPVTNNIGNEARIDIDYSSMSEMLTVSARYTRRHIGQTYPLRTAAFFCAMMPREVYEAVGALDESFGLGFFEDDDYCRRIEKIGLRVACAEDVFIHHHLSASFNRINQDERRALFERNRAIYEAKWGVWQPHGYRFASEIEELRTSSETLPSPFSGQKYMLGTCNMCGNDSRFFFQEVSLWRESLVCRHCRTTSRYRSIASGVLHAVRELAGVDAPSLAALPKSSRKRLRVLDTQVPFYYETCAYPIPDVLKKTGWIDVVPSRYRPDKMLGDVFSDGSVNENLECLTFPDESLHIVITSDVMEHVRLDKKAHREIHRVLKPGGIYVFTVPNVRAWPKTCERVRINDPEDPAKDTHLLEPEYHGDANSPEGEKVLAYRTYGRDLETFLSEIGFSVSYFDDNDHVSCVLNTELYYCVKQ
jgi:GT2 family glycosyltransferase/2-polyprenyl-3-methyl-5-hydroxy-6-metoxy-1,4-benzoquinol methylase/glycosyltransferase involved in cell wall biosynthesis